MSADPLHPTQLDRTAHHVWTLFVDWTTATDTTALPADPETVAQFLADHPAKPATHRRRVGAINAIHRQHGLPEPGRAAAVHAALATRRHQRIRVVSAAVGDLIPRIPTTGWPHGLFGRRDALILTLVAAGLGYTDIAALRRGDIGNEGDTLLIDTSPPQRIHLTSADPAYSPQAVHQRWAVVQSLLVDRFFNAAMLADFLDRNPGRLQAPTLQPKAAQQPLLVSIDRWGYPPLRPTPITAQSIAAITRAHLTGRAPSHRPRRLETPAADAFAPAPQAQPEKQLVLLDGYYDHGIRARRRAKQELTMVGDALDQVTTRAEHLLVQLAQIVGESLPESSELP